MISFLSETGLCNVSPYYILGRLYLNRDIAYIGNNDPCQNGGQLF
jgi:hypothetical protein